MRQCKLPRSGARQDAEYQKRDKKAGANSGAIGIIKQAQLVTDVWHETSHFGG